MAPRVRRKDLLDLVGPGDRRDGRSLDELGGVAKRVPQRRLRVNNPSMRLPPVVLPVVGAVVAVTATGLPVVLHHRDPDVVNLGAGLVLLVAGAQLVAWRSTRLTGMCLVWASVAWFAPDLSGDVAVLGPVLGASTLAHVPLLAAAVLVAPEGRWARRDGPVVALAVVASASATTGGYQVLLPVTGLALVASGVSTWRHLSPHKRRPALAYLCAVLALGLALVAVQVVRLALDGAAESPLFAAYAGLLAVAAVALVGVGPWLQSSAALDVGADALGTLDGLLADVTGDPAAHVVVQVGDGRWVRLDGTDTAAPLLAEAVARVEAARPIPVSLAAAMGDAVWLAGANVRARWALTDKVLELNALRDRLVRVEDDERSALVADLQTGPLAALSELRIALVASGASPELVEHVRGTERDIADVAAGLDPLAGSVTVTAAMHRLAEQLGATFEGDREVEVDTTAGRALWFAGAEALTNAAKHAPGAARHVRLFTDRTEVVLVVLDHGPGPGPAAGLGSAGLVSVRDRLTAVGGTVFVAAADPGTRVEVRVPGTRQHVVEFRADADAGHGATFLASRAPTSEVSP